MQVKWSVFTEYGKGVGTLTCVVVLIVFSLYHSASVFSNYWLTFWTEDPLLLDVDQRNTTAYYDKNMYYLTIYGVLGAVQGLYDCCSLKYRRSSKLTYVHFIDFET